jgi:hypothetical protein
MAGMESEVGTYLAAAGLGLTRGTNLFEGILPETPNTAVSLHQYGGDQSLLGFGVTTGVQYERPRLQVFVRGEPGEFTTARDLAHDIRQALAKVQATDLSGTGYHLVIPMQSPQILERDKNERLVFVFNCRVEKEPS